MQVKKINLAGLLCVICFMYTTCDDLMDGGRGAQIPDLQNYQNTGASVAAREWPENYDCSNFSTQFYQNCYKAGLPCRVRLGVSGGDGFETGAHAWNSVKIDGIWVDWEPQKNSPHSGHTQTTTNLGGIWGDYTQEGVARIIYELVGRYVPKHIIDNYEIDTYWDHDSPFYQSFVHRYSPG
jgi:hypothetical protein